jgi:hypothetical protein
MLHFADSMQAGDGSAMLDCHELQETMHDDLVHSMLMSMWDADALEPRIDAPSAPVDRKTKNRLSAKVSRMADKEYVNLMLAELESLTETFDVYAAYITQLKVHATDEVDSMVSLEQIHAQNKLKIATLRESEASDAANSAPTLMGMPRKERNRIHAQKSRQKKHEFVEDLIKQRDDSWTTMQDVMEYTTAVEGACSVLHDFDDTGCILLQLTETRQRLLMRTNAHEQKHQELKSRMTYRIMHREKF